MAHDVFISYSTKDKAVADAVCAALEACRIRCWIAPRDILPGNAWSESIMEGLANAKVMVLVFSGNSNSSPQVKREVQNAAEEGLAILPFRIVDVPVDKSLRFFLVTQHWLDAMTPPLEQHLKKLVEAVRALLSTMGNLEVSVDGITNTTATTAEERTATTGASPGSGPSGLPQGMTSTKDSLDAEKPGAGRSATRRTQPEAAPQKTLPSNAESQDRRKPGTATSAREHKPLDRETSDDPYGEMIRLLKERYAKGYCTKAQYDETLADLGQTQESLVGKEDSYTETVQLLMRRYAQGYCTKAQYDETLADLGQTQESLGGKEDSCTETVQLLMRRYAQGYCTKAQYDETLADLGQTQESLVGKEDSCTETVQLLMRRYAQGYCTKAQYDETLADLTQGQVAEDGSAQSGQGLAKVSAEQGSEAESMTPSGQPKLSLDERLGLLRRSSEAKQRKEVEETAQRLQQEGERRRYEEEQRRRERDFQTLRALLADQLDREAFLRARETVFEMLKLKPHDAETKEAQSLIFLQLNRTVVLPGGVLMELAPIPAGEFMMGSDQVISIIEIGAHETPKHRVRITQDFWMGKYEVTQAQWQAVMANNPSSHKGDQIPVDRVSWDDCQEFLNKLGRETGDTWRLPTEAEWEYACRAGTTTAFFFGDDAARLIDYAWYSANCLPKGDPTDGKKAKARSWEKRQASMHPVGQKMANPWGLYDMHGNVWEWCADWFDADFYSKSPECDPCNTSAPSIHGQRVWRGGAWNSGFRECHSTTRSGWFPGSTYDVGFRVVCVESR